MDPRLIMAEIGLNRKIMQEQLERLQAFTPVGMMNLSEDLSVSDLMASSVTAQLQGAMDAIKAMNEVEVTVRSSMFKELDSLKVAPPAEQVIDAEFKEIK
ncbi:MAG TPA: hypothetical protein DCG34_11045 [Clostridiales bacterium]|jgi:hypothetical protein|nr:hypothetical protein [Clostridiales bacterium]